MRRNLLVLLTAAALLVPAASAFAVTTSGFGLNVVVNGFDRPEYPARGTVYVEAIRGREYSLRLTNPLPYRVAVALSVDGLNTIDAKHTEPWDAAKWILDPYESIVISGWQVNQKTARRFFFTGENDSYGAALGKTANLGVIEAVFYRERVPFATMLESKKAEERADRNGPAAGVGQRAPAAPSITATQSAPALSDEYAGTGMGDRTRHSVHMVDIDLDRQPAASVRLRYEFRPQLVKLGVLPSWQSPTPLERREHARGFESWCPEQ